MGYSAPRSSLALALLCAAACGGAPSKGAAGADGANDPDKGLGDYIASQGGVAMFNGGDSPAAVPGGLHLELLDKDKPIKLDGIIQEWPARFPLKQAIKGSTSANVSLVVQYDDAKLYVAGEIYDADKIVRTAQFGDAEDHASLVLAFPTASGTPSVYEVGFYIGVPGQSAGSVRYRSGGRTGAAVGDSKIVEAPIQGGWSFEAVLPWSAFPEGRLVRVGLRGVARYTKASAPGTIAAIVASGSGDATSPTSLPPLPSESEQAMIEQLLTEKKLLDQAPKIDRIADVAGDGMRERIAVFGKYLVVCGSGYLGGNKFFFKDLGTSELAGLELRDVTGRGKADMILRRRFTDGGTTREWFEVLSAMSATAEPVTTFAHEIAVSNGTNRIVNSVHAGSREIDVAVESATGWDASSYRENIATDVEPVLFPWGATKSQKFKFDGTKFTKASEVSQTPTGVTTAPGAPPPSIRPKEPPTPPVKRDGGDLSSQLFDLYKRDRGVGADAKPKVDLQVNVHGDGRPERVVLIGHDIVVFGPGFKGGTSYAYVTVADMELRDMNARDLTGAGTADLVVRAGSRKTDSSSSDPVDFDLLLLYQVRADAIVRTFAIETGREQAGKRAQGLVQFIPGGKGFDVDAQPGRVTGWTQQSYPWRQEAPGSGSIEPLLLPWGGIARVRYSWNGSTFAKQ
jgi:hypothetical protein